MAWNQKESVQEIFQNMNYGSEIDETNDADLWFGRNCLIDRGLEGVETELKSAINGQKLCDVIVPAKESIKAFLDNIVVDEWFKVDAHNAAASIYNLSKALEKNCDFITQLEITTRGICSKDTKRTSLKLLTEYLSYYSSFCHKIRDKPKGVVVAIISKNNALWTLGAILGPVLASGHQIVLQTCLEFTPIADYIRQLGINAGFKENTIKLIPGDNINPAVFLLGRNVSSIVIFDNILTDKYLKRFNDDQKKILNFGPNGTSMLVFDFSDLNSAIFSITNAAWGCRSLGPFALRQIFVQENIFDDFVEKLKQLLRRLKVGRANEKNVDVVKPDEDTLHIVTQIVAKAETSVEILQHESKFPVVLIGGNIFPNNVIKADILTNVPIVTVVAFRTINEAITLANNTKQGLGVSVWTENTSLAHEIIAKLNFGNIWLNSHGLFSPDLAFTALKGTANCSLGGEIGFREYVSRETVISKTDKIEESCLKIDEIIAEAKRAQCTWRNLSSFERKQILRYAVFKNNSNLYHLIENLCEEKIIQFNDYNAISLVEPFGVIVMELTDNKTNYFPTIFSHLLHGNAIILLYSEGFEASSDFEFLSSFYKGLVQKEVYRGAIAKALVLHKGVDVFIAETYNSAFSELSMKDCTRLSYGFKDPQFKNVWFDKGQTFL